MVPGGLALFPPQTEGNARKEAASFQAGETISKPQPPSKMYFDSITDWTGRAGGGVPSRNTCEASIAGFLS